MAVFIYKILLLLRSQGSWCLGTTGTNPSDPANPWNSTNFLCQTDALPPLGPQHPPHWKPEDARQQYAQRPTRHSRLSTRTRTWPHDSLTQREGGWEIWCSLYGGSSGTEDSRAIRPFASDAVHCACARPHSPNPGCMRPGTINYFGGQKYLNCTPDTQLNHSPG